MGCAMDIRRTRTRRARPGPVAVVAAPPPRPEQAARAPGSRSTSTSPTIPSATGSLSTTTPRCASPIPDSTSTSPCALTESTLYRTYLGHVPLARPIAPVGSSSQAPSGPFACSSTPSSHLPSPRSSTPKHPNDNAPVDTGTQMPRSVVEHPPLPADDASEGGGLLDTVSVQASEHGLTDVARPVAVPLAPANAIRRHEQ